ncbi:hypothetical protein Vqi01_28570 [Micromonospora qiuiae]|uniref:Uncharacterized protein n=1 Tax=Micromonospora qiuiae TaxID=502268 RepID=A0ABQ4JCK4_9ACTN|nr:hypothetical protein Vqi01_28570 [Micromonospora qiuiae]
MRGVHTGNRQGGGSRHSGTPAPKTPRFVTFPWDAATRGFNRRGYPDPPQPVPLTDRDTPIRRNPCPLDRPSTPTCGKPRRSPPQAQLHHAWTRFAVKLLPDFVKKGPFYLTRR